MKRTLIIMAAAAFLSTTFASCNRDLCAAYSKEYKSIQKKKAMNPRVES